MSLIEVKLWGTLVGRLGYAQEGDVREKFATFEYDQRFPFAQVKLSPLKMDAPPLVHRFDALSYNAFHGLPGIFSDSLPDKFGNQLIDELMAQKGVPSEEVTPLDRLMYIGERGMGAIEYHPAKSLNEKRGKTALDIDLLAELADLVQTNKEAYHEKLEKQESKEDALKLIRIGSSAGGARSKALVSTHEGKFFDGTLDHGIDHRYWLMKFDTLNNRDRDHKDPKGMTKVEYIYTLLAKEAMIKVPHTDYVATGDDFHFMSERFDRIVRKEAIDKLHYASWSGLAHADRDGRYSYEQLVLSARQLGLSQESIREIFKRAVFNIVGRNQDDHTKNFGFLMDREGKWSLSPAFDVTYSYDPKGRWTRNHQISLNGKRSDFLHEDITSFGLYCNLSKRKSTEIVKETIGIFSRFEKLAKEYEVEESLRETIQSNLRLTF